MKTPYGGPVKQHQSYAITGEANDGDGDDNFGVAPHNHTDKPFSEPNVHRKPHLRDGRRAVRPGASGFHRNPGSPDHGPFE